jgi:hypothetical protein
MTRDEAEKIARPFWCGDAGQAVDTLVALGVLKLDKELPVEARLEIALYESYSHHGDRGRPNYEGAAQGFLNRLDSQGLKVVAK